MKTTTVILTLLVIVGILAIGCQHELKWPQASIPTDTTSKVPNTPPPNNPPPPVGNSCSPDTVYFETTILPLLTSNCAMSGCHNGLSGGDAGEYTLNTYAGIMKIVNPGNAAGSRLVSVISSGKMPPRGHTPLTPAQLSSIQTWINQGALDNSCTATTCDTTNVTYSGSIAPLITTYCQGCHSGSSASAGVDLTTYAGVLAQVSNGKLWGDVSHTSGFNAMPLGGSILSACDLNIINAWIQKGAPNN